MPDFDTVFCFPVISYTGMSRAEEYLPWAETFIRARRVVAVRIDDKQGEYEALSETGSIYFIERLEQAQALLLVLQGHSSETRLEGLVQ
jgi:hypothetical protein